MEAVTLNKDSALFELMNMDSAGENISECLTCGICNSRCSWYGEEGGPVPRRIVRMAFLGLDDLLAKSPMLWDCHLCNRCTLECPMGIDMAAIMDTLRHIAIKEGAVVAEPDILNFHRDVLHSIKHYGRTHKIEVMLRYKARKWEWFSDLAVGIKMLAKRKLHLRASKVLRIDVVRKSFQPKPIRVAHE